MRLAVLSDIHGNLPALQAVLADIERCGVDAYILAGDYYACPDGVATRRMISRLPGWQIHGNGEVYLRRETSGEQPPEWAFLQQFALHRWVLSQLQAEDWAFVHALPDQQVIYLPGTDPIRVAHGSHRSPFEDIFPDAPDSVLHAVWAETSEAVFICGHTHVPWVREHAGRLALNPGAVSGPLDGFIGAQYALLDYSHGRWQAELRRVPYDIAALQRAFETSGEMAAAPVFSRVLLAAIETGQDVPLKFLSHAFTLADTMGCGQVRFLPDAVWNAAADSFVWP